MPEFLLDFFKLVGFDIIGFERAWPYLLGAFLISYLIGAAPFGIFVARAFGLPRPKINRLREYWGQQCAEIRK